MWQKQNYLINVTSLRIYFAVQRLKKTWEKMEKMGILATHSKFAVLKTNMSMIRSAGNCYQGVLDVTQQRFCIFFAFDSIFFLLQNWNDFR